MALIDTLNGDVKAAMKGGDKIRLNTVRMLIAALKNERISAGADLSADQELQLLATQAKRRRESITLYQEGGREDLAAQESAELTVIEGYLPEQLTEDDVRAMVVDIMAATGAESMRDMGKVMGQLMPKLKGRFDGKLAKGVVQSALQ
ncbi:MAG: GatB/YqeY domain-containing protein [Myxococcota bacterium]